MSSHLGIAQAKRLRDYHLLKNQPERIIRASLGLQPHECHRVALERLRVALERAPDPRPHTPRVEGRERKKGYNARLLKLLGDCYESGEPLPPMKTLTKLAQLSKGRISNITTLLQDEGRLTFRLEGSKGQPVRYIAHWEPPL